MLITMVFSLPNSKLYKYASIDALAFVITYIITPRFENQIAKSAFKTSTDDLGEKKGASILSILNHFKSAPAPAV